jgi:Na+/H+-dicarboxylate symporter/ABC-type amino acid transport substrate-binding protein
MALGSAPRVRTGAPRLSTRILLGLLLGIATGLVIGERAAAFQVVADAYIRLLQMTVLPYVTISLVRGLGALHPPEAARLGAWVGTVLLGLWAIALGAVFCFPAMFPSVESAAFFSTTLLEDHASLDLIGLYIPDNPFHALANNVVPAVVLFSALLGVALIGVPDKAALLQALEVVTRAVARVAGFIVSLSPYGLFAIAAVTAGTFDPRQAAQLQIYVAGYVAVSLVLALWVLPGLVAALTPIPRRAVLAHSRDALLMAFSTGSLLVVLPLLTEQSRDLVRRYARLAPSAEPLPGVIMAASFNFPHAAKLLSLSFVLFAAWFTGAPLQPAQYPILAGTGLLVLFGSTSVAIPFLLDFFKLPADTFQLFLATSVVNARFGTLLSAVHTLTVALVGTCAVAGAIRFEAPRLLRFAFSTLALALVGCAGIQMLAGYLANRPYDRDRALTGLRALRDRGAPAHVFRSAAPPLAAATGSVLDRVRTRRTLRVGYLDDSLPFAFTNTGGELVGFDVDMAYELARELGTSLELVPVHRRLFAEGLDPSVCDLVMSGTAVTTARALQVRYSAPYLDETLAFVVLDHRRAEFASWDAIRALRPLRLGVPRDPTFLQKIHAELPGADIVGFDRPGEMFEAHGQPLDAVVLTAERGSAYTLLHPEYSVAVPGPRPSKVPLAYVIAGRDQALAELVNAWIDLKRKDGTIDELFSHWILGRQAGQRQRRWSVLDDVLHWPR